MHIAERSSCAQGYGVSLPLARMLTIETASLRNGGKAQVLIFSQMTKMLDLLHYYLEERGFDPCRIDGSIPWEERQARATTPQNLRVNLLQRSRKPWYVRWKSAFYSEQADKPLQN